MILSTDGETGGHKNSRAFAMNQKVENPFVSKMNAIFRAQLLALFKKYLCHQPEPMFKNMREQPSDPIRSNG